MTLLPIRFQTTIKSSTFNKAEILDLIEEYLKNEDYNYIVRKSNRIIFHKANGWWNGWDNKTYLVSGMVIIKEKNSHLQITNGNWMVFLIALPFILFWIMGKSQYSTYDEKDISIGFNFFLVLFVGNLILRIKAHFAFRNKIREMINYA